MKRRIGKYAVLMALCMLMSVVLAGCSGKKETPAEPEILLGFSQLGSESAWRIGNTTDIEEKAESYDISLIAITAVVI